MFGTKPTKKTTEEKIQDLMSFKSELKSRLNKSPIAGIFKEFYEMAKDSIEADPHLKLKNDFLDELEKTRIDTTEKHLKLVEVEINRLLQELAKSTSVT